MVSWDKLSSVNGKLPGGPVSTNRYDHVLVCTNIFDLRGKFFLLHAKINVESYLYFPKTSQ